MGRAGCRAALMAAMTLCGALGLAVLVLITATHAQRSIAMVNASATDGLIAEPAAGDEPFVALIAGARRSVDIVMYELRDSAVERALVADVRRGVAVRVLLDRDRYGATATDNAAAFRYLTAHHGAVRYSASRFTFTHEKAIVVDRRAAAIMTLNLAGSYASTRDFAVIDTAPADVAAVDAVFAADFAQRPLSPSSGTGDLVWSPGSARSVLALIGSARRSIVLESEEMAYAPAVSALCAAARRRVAVTVVMTYAREWIAPFDRLTACGVRVRVYFGQRYYIHAKVIDIDGARALVGSQNLSATSLDENRELGVIVSDPASLAALRADLGRDAAGGVSWQVR